MVIAPRAFEETRKGPISSSRCHVDYTRPPCDGDAVSGAGLVVRVAVSPLVKFRKYFQPRGFGESIRLGAGVEPRRGSPPMHRKNAKTTWRKAAMV